MPAPRRLSDPRTIRALAHPARLAIIDALTTGEELTATQCAQLTGLSPSATAYHLNFLERYGFVEPAPARPDRRERPWRANPRGTQLDLDVSTPAGVAAASALAAAAFDKTREMGLRYAESEHAEPEEWRIGALANADLWLTAEEAARLAGELSKAVERYRGGTAQGRRRVRIMNVVVPHPTSSIQ